MSNPNFNRDQGVAQADVPGPGSSFLTSVDLGPAARVVFTTRYAPDTLTGSGGGASAGLNPYNLATHVGDDRDTVLRRRAHLENLVGGEIAWMNQTHSTVVASARCGSTPDADGLLLLAERAGGPLAAGVLVADCVPLVLANSTGTVLAAVHAGRQGMLNGIVATAVEAMCAQGVQPAEIWAVIGPAICGQCYEVSPELYTQAQRLEPASACNTRWGTPGIDVPAGVQTQLRRLGVTQIQDLAICTYEEPDLFSYRREGQTGRLAGIVWSRKMTRREQCSAP